MPQTYIVAVEPAATGRTCRSDVSYSRSSGPRPGNAGTCGEDHDCMAISLGAPTMQPAQRAEEETRNPPRAPTMQPAQRAEQETRNPPRAPTMRVRVTRRRSPRDLYLHSTLCGLLNPVSGKSAQRRRARWLQCRLIQLT